MDLRQQVWLIMWSYITVAELGLVVLWRLGRWPANVKVAVSLGTILLVPLLLPYMSGWTAFILLRWLPARLAGA